MEVSYVLANFKIRGLKAENSGKALVDTGAAVTVIDESLADYIGVELIGSVLKVRLRGVCCEVEGELVNVKYLEMDGRAVGSTSVVKFKFSEELKDALREIGARDDIIIGVRDLAIGFVVNVRERKLEYVGPMLI